MTEDIMKLSENPEKFLSMLKKGDIRVSIHGQGYVGLPLSILFAIKGIKVVGVSKDKKAIEKIQKGESPIDETDPNSLLGQGAKEINQKCTIDGVNLFEYESHTFCPMCLRCFDIVENIPIIKHETVNLRGKLKTLTDYLKEALDSGNYELTDDNIEATKKTDIHIITVPTYADDYSIVLKVCEDIAKGLQKDGDVIINKSTVPVGATDEADALMKKNTDKKFGICHMQERIAEGRALKDFQELPRTVGSNSKDANIIAKVLFEILGAPVFMFDSPKVTEASKVFENSYRDCNIGIANDYAMFCEKHGLDVYQVINAANTLPKTRIFQPGMVGGHCLPEDTYYVANPMKDELKEKNVIMAGRKMNEQVPFHSIELLKKGLNEAGIAIKGSKVCLYGVAFKGNTDDTRLTGAKIIADELKKNGIEVYVYDPWVPEEAQKDFGNPVEFEKSLNLEAVIIATDHTEFYSIDFSKGNYKVLVDMRNITEDLEKIKKSGKIVLKYGVGK
ncbi:nucleotide sugar dehydrogenase [Candidatus Undinarchaeota archaeon]